VAAFAPVSGLNPNAALKGNMIGTINPAGIPALTIAGIFFLIVNVLFGVYLWRHGQEWFGPDERLDGDRTATRYLQVVVICIPLLVLTGRIFVELVGLWIN
jgi:hypothetical protein